MTMENIIFVVDDDSSARKGFARLLRTAGYDVRDFASAADFLKGIYPGVSGCLVLDARMSEITCEEIFKEISARNIDLSIIVVTGDDDPETRLRAQNMNAAGFFRKPVDGPALLDAINWALQTESSNTNF